MGTILKPIGKGKIGQDENLCGMLKAPGTKKK
jgi:hypothetical protein